MDNMSLVGLWYLNNLAKSNNNNNNLTPIFYTVVTSLWSTLPIYVEWLSGGHAYHYDTVYLNYKIWSFF